MADDKKQIFVPRVTQLDANEFENEIHKLLKSDLLEITKYLEPGSLTRIKPEIDLFIRLLIFKYSLWKGNSSFGQQMLNVEYLDGSLTRRKRVWFAFFNYFLPYLKDKYAYTFLHWKNDAARRAIDKIELLINMSQFINLLIFLRQGQYPSLLDRLLGLKWTTTTKLSRNVGYSYMTRELMWHGFMELFMFVLPLINYQYLKRRVMKVLHPFGVRREIVQNVTHEVNTLCNICKETPVYPCRISMYCQHVACYYCIKTNTLADTEYTCSTCGARSTANENLEYLNHEI